MKIFISYGRKDALETAKDIAKHLWQMGHEPWLDIENGIPLGAPFDIRIEVSISESQLLLALLTDSSIRPDGFCRNEILYAQAKDVPIFPIRLHKIIPPIQIISLNYMDISDDKIIPYDKLATILDTIAKSGQVNYEPPKSQKSWWEGLKGINYSEELARHGDSFTGRQWVMRKISEWSTNPKSKLLLITANVGAGKSALSAQMTNFLNVRGIHFCSRSNIDSCYPKSWLSELIYQLAMQFLSYRMVLEGLTAPNWGERPESLFRNLIIEPLRQCESQLNITEPWIFVIDSLDESLAEANSDLIDLLTESAEVMPAWFRIVATSRPDQSIIAKFEINKSYHYHINLDSEENSKDIQDYIGKFLSRHSDVEEANTIKNKISVIKNISAGNFLIAKLVLSALTDSRYHGTINLENFIAMPAHISGLYDILFRNRFKDQHNYDHEILPLINCLVASQEPLSQELLLKASQLPEHVAKKGLLALSQFLSRSKASYQLFHQSVVGWLIDSDKSTRYAASVKTGHCLLAEACWAEYQTDPDKISPYTHSYLPTHLVNNESWDSLLILIEEGKLHLFSRWIEGGEGEVGLNCLLGTIKFLDKHKREQITAAGLATQTARILSKHGRYDEAELWLKYTLEKTSYFKGRRLRAIALHEIGSLRLYKQEYRQSCRYYRKALSLCIWGKPQYFDEAAANLLGLATIYHTQYNFMRAIRYAKTALKKAKRSGDLNHYIAGERLLGTVYKSLGQYEESREHLAAGLALAELGDAGTEKIRLLSLQGWLEYELATSQKKVPQGSKAFFEQALTAAKKFHDYFSYIDAKLSLIWCDLAEGITDDIEEKLIVIQQDLPRDRHFELIINTELAFAAYKHKKGDLQLAEERYRNAILLSDAHGFRFLYAKAHVGIGAIHWHSDRKVAAEKMWKIANEASNAIYKARPSRIEISIELCKNDVKAVPR